MSNKKKKEQTKCKCCKKCDSTKRRYEPEDWRENRDPYLKEMKKLDMMKYRIEIASNYADLKDEEGKRFFNDEWIKSNIFKEYRNF